MFTLPNQSNPYGLSDRELANLSSSNLNGLKSLLEQEQAQLKRYNNSFDKEALGIKVKWLKKTIKAIEEA